MTTNDSMINESCNSVEVQMQYIADMVSAMDVDYGRLEELRQEKVAQSWAFNFSIVGCLPDNYPLLFSSAEEAREAMVAELNSWVEVEEEIPFSEGSYRASSGLKSYREAASHLSNSFDMSVVVHGWHFWVTDDIEFEHQDELDKLEAAANGCLNRDDAEGHLLRACRRLTDNGEMA